MPEDDWDVFIRPQPWVVRPGAEVVLRVVRDPRAADFGTELPTLERLLNKAARLEVDVDDERFELLTWTTLSGDKVSWLCARPSPDPGPELFFMHRELLKSFGGIVERSLNEPSTWLINCDDALTEREAHADRSLQPMLDAYAWMIEDSGGSWPIDPAHYYSICREANGNTTACHRDDGAVLFFAPDHSVDHIVPLEGCPPYSLYRIPAAPDFVTWVETVAHQWLDAIG